MDIYSEKKIKKEPEGREPPTKPRSNRLFATPRIKYSNLEFAVRTISNPYKQEDKPYITEFVKGKSWNISFNVQELKHHNRSNTLKLYACFADIESMKNFDIEYNMVVGNMPDKIPGRLDVIVGAK